LYANSAKLSIPFNVSLKSGINETLFISYIIESFPTLDEFRVLKKNYLPQRVKKNKRACSKVRFIDLDKERGTENKEKSPHSKIAAGPFPAFYYTGYSASL
jgi:hypothetical protein